MKEITLETYRFDESAFIDYAVKHLYDIYPNSTNLDDIEKNYLKDMFPKTKLGDLPFLSDGYKVLNEIEFRHYDEYWTSDNFIKFGCSEIYLTPKACRIIHNHSSISNYLEYKKQKLSRKTKRENTKYSIQVYLPIFVFAFTVFSSLYLTRQEPNTYQQTLQLQEPKIQVVLYSSKALTDSLNLDSVLLENLKVSLQSDIKIALPKK